MNSQLPLFFAPDFEVGQTTHTLDEASARHAMQVLRMVAGNSLQLTNGRGVVAQATIASPTSGSKKNCVVRISDVFTAPNPATRSVAIAISPVKNASRFEWFLEKATELGVAHIFPLMCKRTVGGHFRYDRLKGICVSAMLQSQQSWLPTLHQPLNLAQLLQHQFSVCLIAHCVPGSKQGISQVATTLNAQSVLLLVGPEGDFTLEEIELALAAGCQPCSLGATRLRTETAGLVGASVLCLG